MADCTCNPKYLLAAAERSLSDSLFDRYADWMFKNICPNPFEEGRKREMVGWQETHNRHARKLIWC